MEEVSYVRFFFALAFVIGLIGITAVLFRKFAIEKRFLSGSGKRRLGIVEVIALDSRRRLVIVKRDSQEHLLLIGGNNDVVVERNLEPENSDGGKVAG